MKKIILIVLFLMPSLLVAQEFSKGTNAINAGISFGGYYGSFDSSSEGIGYGINFERGIWEVPGPGVVSLGAHISRKTFRYETSFVDYKWSYTTIGVRGAYHFNGLNVKNLDVYGGVMLSYDFVSSDGGGSYSSRFGPTGFIGGRWYFSKNIAVFVEGGYGVAFLTTGLTLRI